MRNKHRYDIKVQPRDDGWFTILVPALPSVQTQAAEEHDAPFLARHAIGQWLECSPESVVVKVVQ